MEIGAVVERLEHRGGAVAERSVDEALEESHTNPEIALTAANSLIGQGLCLRQRQPAVEAQRELSLFMEISQHLELFEARARLDARQPQLGRKAKAGKKIVARALASLVDGQL